MPNSVWDAFVTHLSELSSFEAKPEEKGGGGKSMLLVACEAVCFISKLQASSR